MPFGALPVPVVNSQPSVINNKTISKGPPTANTTQPLIVDHEIVTLPSASVLAALRQEVAGRKPANL